MQNYHLCINMHKNAQMCKKKIVTNMHFQNRQKYVFYMHK